MLLDMKHTLAFLEKYNRGTSEEVMGESGVSSAVNKTLKFTRALCAAEDLDGQWRVKKQLKTGQTAVENKHSIGKKVDHMVGGIVPGEWCQTGGQMRKQIQEDEQEVI